VTTNAQNDLAEAYQRLVAALACLDDQPDGKPRARTHRERLTAHMTTLCDQLAGKQTARCEKHVGEVAHNCRACRSERIAVPSYPETPAEFAEVEARMLGESS
jgi:hypothetical protein